MKSVVRLIDEYILVRSEATAIAEKVHSKTVQVLSGGRWVNPTERIASAFASLIARTPPSYDEMVKKWQFASELLYVFEGSSFDVMRTHIAKRVNELSLMQINEPEPWKQYQIGVQLELVETMSRTIRKKSNYATETERRKASRRKQEDGTHDTHIFDEILDGHFATKTM